MVEKILMQTVVEEGFGVQMLGAVFGAPLIPRSPDLDARSA